MHKIDFNKDWNFGAVGAEKHPVTLPHDAMQLTRRSSDAPGGSAHGFYEGGIYEYEKTFLVPNDWKGKHILFEFEGIYKNSTVSINGTVVGEHSYGYTGFTVCADGLLNMDAPNTIHVVADNSKLPNSRWYTGSGIYRPVWVWAGEAEGYIDWQGVKVSTVSMDTDKKTAQIRVESSVHGDSVASAQKVTDDISVECNSSKALDIVIFVEIWKAGKCVASGFGLSTEITIANAAFWSDETPELYTCRIFLKKGDNVLDTYETTFGIRMLKWSNQGFFVNGKSTLMRGGCVHHDNGIIGAACFDESEDRRIRILKEMGFNAIRSSHNPTSRAMLEACDRYGMYLIDETFDMWYMHKNKYDYAGDFNENWETDTAAMVQRDYNHPSVIMYSICNEPSEPVQEKGVEVAAQMVEFIHSLDSTRPVTGGVNLMVLSNAAKGKAVYNEDGTGAGQSSPQENAKKSGKSDGEKEDKVSNGSLLFNTMVSFVGTGMNNGANNKKADAVTSPVLDTLDIAGYNYASGRYPLEEKAHPDRIIFGSETFPQDIAKNWEMVKKYPYLIGDFIWTAWDYLGEAGIGAWSYTGGMPFNRPYPWLLAGAGVVDILGTPDASCRYMSVVWGLRKEPVIGVRPVNHPGVRVSTSVWRGTNAIESWSWRNCDGNKAIVEVYADAAKVELFLNKKSLGRKAVRQYKATYKTRYASGELEAVSYDGNGKEIARTSLTSATGIVRPVIHVENSTVYANACTRKERGISITPHTETKENARTTAHPGEILYFNIAMEGENGITDSNSDVKLKASVEVGELLGFGSANPCTEEYFTEGYYTTYQGRAQAIVRAGDKGTVTLTLRSNEQETSASVDIL